MLALPSPHAPVPQLPVEQSSARAAPRRRTSSSVSSSPGVAGEARDEALERSFVTSEQIGEEVSVRQHEQRLADTQAKLLHELGVTFGERLDVGGAERLHDRNLASSGRGAKARDSFGVFCRELAAQPSQLFSRPASPR